MSLLTHPHPHPQTQTHTHTRVEVRINAHIHDASGDVSLYCLQGQGGRTMSLLTHSHTQTQTHTHVEVRNNAHVHDASGDVSLCCLQGQGGRTKTLLTHTQHTQRSTSPNDPQMNRSVDSWEGQNGGLTYSIYVRRHTHPSTRCWRNETQGGSTSELKRCRIDQKVAHM